MPEQDHNAGELNQAYIVFDVIFVSNHQATEIVQPGEEPLDFPPALEAAQGPTVLSLALGSTSPAVRRNHFSTEAAEHFLIERIAIVGFVANQLFGHLGDKPLFKGL